MKKLILFILLIINLLPLISQTGYPKEIILQSDTLLAFKYNQIREINKGLEEGEGCKILLHQTEILVLQQDTTIKQGTLLVNNLKSQIENYNIIVNDQKQLLDLKDKQYKQLISKKKTGEIILWTGVSIGIGTSIGLLIWGMTK